MTLYRAIAARPSSQRESLDGGPESRKPRLPQFNIAEWLAAMLLLLCVGWVAEAQSFPFSATFLVGQQHFSDEGFKDVYGGDPAVYALEVGFQLNSAVKVFLGVDHFRKTGFTTVTQDPTSLDMTNLDVGFRCAVLEGRLRPYLGGGVAQTWVRESIPEEDSRIDRLGAFLEIGLEGAITPCVFADLRLKQRILKAGGIDMESLSGLVGAGIRF